jgi:hypothetical protein
MQEISKAERLYWQKKSDAQQLNFLPVVSTPL